jgi:hypothetical protein
MLQPTETSYFSPPAAGLDPRLFRNGKLDSSVRSAILQLLLNHLNALYTGADGWYTAWLAGSGVSHQWAANREPGDLDCLVGINFPSFRQSNSDYRGLSDKEIAEMLNEGFRELLQPRTALFLGSFELTFFTIVAPSILEIKPYAAYSLTTDDWVVKPEPMMQQQVPEWDSSVEQDRFSASGFITRFISAKNKFNEASNDAVKANARSEMRVASSQALALYNDIHNNRSAAFSPTGKGYSDFNNYRWQSNKKTGVIQALRSVKAEMDAHDAELAKSTYGVDLPDTNTLIRRAATYKH